MASTYYKDKKVWITGASSGIGRGFAEELSRRGASIILSSRRKAVLEEIRAGLKLPAKASVAAMDMEVDSSIEQATESVLAGHKIDILILNAGISQRAAAMDTSIETEERIMSTNYHGLVRLTKLVLPQMLENGGGHLVVMSSVAGKVGISQRSSYAASKHALHGYFDSLRAEIEHLGVSITLICPGYVFTEISSNAVLGDGTSQGNIDLNSKNGMPVEKFVDKALRGIRRKKSELLIGGTEIMAVYVKRFFPSVIRKIMKNRKA